jgi:hypothetical protein
MADDAQAEAVADGAEYGFRPYRCECCDALPGDRFRVLCFDPINADEE